MVPQFIQFVAVSVIKPGGNGYPLDDLRVVLIRQLHDVALARDGVQAELLKGRVNQFDCVKQVGQVEAPSH